MCIIRWITNIDWTVVHLGGPILQLNMGTQIWNASLANLGVILRLSMCQNKKKVVAFEVSGSTLCNTKYFFMFDIGKLKLEANS